MIQMSAVFNSYTICNNALDAHDITQT